MVDGISMWPALKNGYQVSFRPVNSDTLVPGDIVVVRGRGRRGELRWKVHRLLGRVGPFFLEAGDNAFSCSLVTAEEIVGLVTKAWNQARRPVALPRVQLDSPRFRFFLFCAHSFVFAHECKDRLIGQRRSIWLWRASVAYRAGLGALGVSVPVLDPK